MGTPKILKIADQVFLRWPKTASRAENSKKQGSKKGPVSGPVLGWFLNGILAKNIGYLGAVESALALL